MTPNGELELCLKEIKEIAWLPILGEIYKECLPIESELEAEFEEFRALFFQALGLLEYLKEGRVGPKTHEWYRDWYSYTKGKSNFFKGDDFF